MIDFHSHILPGMDDGSSCPEESVEMMRSSSKQGVDIMFATSHFYPDEEDPTSFLKRRQTAQDELTRYCADNKLEDELPKIISGAEVYFFPGMATCDDLKLLTIGNTPLILVEPPMAPFSRNMLDEIEAIGTNLGLVPVVAHLDRYCRMLRDESLFDVVSERRILIQVNASFFLHKGWSDFALEMLESDMFQFIGSDCHNTEDRPPNITFAKRIISQNNLNKSLAKIDNLIYNIIVNSE